MSTIDEIKAIAGKVWPNAASIDVHPGTAGTVSFTGPNPQGLRVMALDTNGKVIDQLSAPALDELKAKLERRLQMKARKS
jgi:hypothetical protein